MSVARFVSASLTAALLAAAPVLLSASDKAVPSKDGTMAAQSTTIQFAAMKDVKAAPMSSTELKAVKGQHVHFVTVRNGKLHFAGNFFEHNWSNLGGTDGEPVAPSYKGLCVAHGNGSIFIPTSPPGAPPTPVTLQCPPGS